MRKMIITIGLIIIFFVMLIVAPFLEKTNYNINKKASKTRKEHESIARL